MKKSEVTEVLLTLWNMVDQAGYDMTIRDAFANCPVEWQKKFITDMLESDEWDRNFEQDIIDKAKKIVGY
jgi:hypothetical protein